MSKTKQGKYEECGKDYLGYPDRLWSLQPVQWRMAPTSIGTKESYRLSDILRTFNL
ncbi:MAG: hypothetical protein KJ900_12855 [Proteobacteria bacterium]|nr:hypothetical protein [Pseudomonadota bacterium]MCG2745053.1 hypothetical protein [Desulfobacteraceae bacterium]MBU4030251.1 hypothetical protein [Pseudomonadota bacterium]MBU4043766.1 hypothetical protein [Pseudomonadota bacterium]MBU4107480.1 hypothetical protein [Pseudomonadota bacterium]